MEKELSQIKNCLYIIIALLIMLLFTIIIVNGDKKEVEEQTSIEYDVSDFKSVDFEGFMAATKASGYNIIYIGRSSCGYCANFIPVMKQAQVDYGYTTIYYDITQVIDFVNNKIIDEDQYEQILALDDYVEEQFGSTPMVLVFKDGKYVNGWVGYDSYDNFASFIEESGLTK